MCLLLLNELLLQQLSLHYQLSLLPLHAVISSAEEKALLFVKKDLSPVRSHNPTSFTMSRLSEQLDSSASMGENPFLEYAKFDGKVGQFMHSLPDPRHHKALYEAQPAQIYIISYVNCKGLDQPAISIDSPNLINV